VSGTRSDGKAAATEDAPGDRLRQARGELADRRALWSEVVRGLADRPRSLPAKLLYDGPGAELFEEITRLEEYYLTRTEMGILERRLSRVAELVGPGARVVEYGSGSGRKTTMLLDALAGPSALVAVDIARSQLLSFSERVNRTRPDLAVVPVVADYTKPFALPEPADGAGATLFFFPGSTIGNFEPDEARRFLRIMAEAGGEGALLLIGVDLRKPRSVLEAAYDDRRGVTAEFNRNALQTLNRRLGGDFEPERFRHRAPWNAERSRIEMWLVSDRDQTATLDPGLRGISPLTLRFAEGDGIRTEHSYKYTLERFGALTSEAGWRMVERWTDPEAWFAVDLLRREG
jgi:L-histidine Nalpha-methyltransferase